MGSIYGRDNFRDMLETLQSRMMLDEIHVCFNTRNDNICQPLWEYTGESWDRAWQFTGYDWKTMSIPQPNWTIADKWLDDYLINCFLCGLCAWPMVCDNPDLFYDGEHCTWWTKVPERAPELEEGPEVEHHNFDTLRPLFLY